MKHTNTAATSAFPWWWDAAPRTAPDDALPDECDVAIVGSGYTGLSAALPLLRAGRSVVIVEQGVAGEGASSRNGGMLGSGHKIGYAGLKARFGHDQALRILTEGLESLSFTRSLIETENIDCYSERCGRFRGAWKASDYDVIAREVEWLQRHIDLNASMVSRSDQHQQVTSEKYHGGCIYHDHGSLHPGLFHSGLLQRVIDAGGVLSCHNPALGIDNDVTGKRLRTMKGSLRTGHVIVATNGYRGALVPGWRNATVPASSFLIATEPLGEGVAESLIPSGRMIVETRKRFGYYRQSPDRQRIVFGGRAALQKMDTTISQRILTDMLTGLFPQLERPAISHSWTGFTAMTRDSIPHLVSTDTDVTVVGGYNGSGVAMAPYLGYKAAQRLLGNPEGQTVFADVPLLKIPLYTGNPWFLKPLNTYYRFLDKRERSV